MAVPTYTKSGAKATAAATLNDQVFGVVPKQHDLLNQAYVTYLANGRENLAVTKTRGLVRGGGKKPFRQKGTGRARAGSTRGPIWRTGGIVFGPTGHENYSKGFNLKAKRLAIRQALSLAAEAGAIKVIESFDCPTAKVKPTIELLGKVGATGRTLLVVGLKDDAAERATRNVPKLKLVQAKYLNVYDILNAETVVISRDALEMVHEWLGTAPAAGKEAK